MELLLVEDDRDVYKRQGKGWSGQQKQHDAGCQQDGNNSCYNQDASF